MKGWKGLGQVGVLALALALTTSGFAEERVLSVEGQRFLMRGREQAWASGQGHLAMSHGRVCSVATQAGIASCHAHIVHDEMGRPFATPGPSGYAPADLRNAYSVTGTGAAGKI